MSTDELKQRMRLLDNEIRIMKSDITSIDSESDSQRKCIKENMDKIKLNKQLPYLVGNVVEVLDMEDDEEEEDGAAADIDSQRKVRRAKRQRDCVEGPKESSCLCLSEDMQELRGRH